MPKETLKNLKETNERGKVKIYRIYRYLLKKQIKEQKKEILKKEEK